MKALRYLIFFFLAILLIGISLFFTGPKTFDVHRSIEINAPRHVVYPWIRTFENMQKWSPFLEKDPQMIVSTEGTDGTVGAKNTWSGNKDVGKGSQTITKLVTDERYESKLEFIEPMNSTADAYIQLSDTQDGMTQVTWGFKGTNNPVERILFNFMNMDQMMGPEFDKGLTKLKTLVEGALKAATAYAVSESAFSGQLYAGVRGKMKFSEVAKFLADNYTKVYSIAGDKAIGKPTSITYLWDEATQQTEVVAAVAVSAKVDGLENISLPAARMISVDFYGWYEDIGPAHNALGEFVKSKNLHEIPPVIEEYITDPTVEPDTSKWLTHVRYFVQ